MWQSFDRRAMAAMVLALAILAGMGWLNYSNTSALVATTQSIINRHEVMVALGDLLSGLNNAEAGQLGYVITGREVILKLTPPLWGM